MNSNKQILFVYGTLLAGEGNHGLLDSPSTTALGPFTSPPIFDMLDLGSFPGVIKEGNTPIKGELYEVDVPVWERVERLEGYPSFYGRTTFPTPNGEAHIYVLDRGKYGHDPDRIIASGDWRNR